MTFVFVSSYTFSEHWSIVYFFFQIFVLVSDILVLHLCWNELDIKLILFLLRPVFLSNYLSILVSFDTIEYLFVATILFIRYHIHKYALYNKFFKGLTPNQNHNFK